MQIDLLVEVDFLLTNDVELHDLLVDDLLPLLESSIDLVDLVLNLLYLQLSILDHLFGVRDLALKSPDEVLFLCLLMYFARNLVQMLDEALLLQFLGSHVVEKIVDVLDVFLGLFGIGCDICHEKSKFASVGAEGVLKFDLKIGTALLDVVLFSLKFFDLLWELLRHDGIVSVFILLELNLFGLELV